MTGAGGTVPGTRCMVFLCEDDRSGHRSLADVLLERARAAGVAWATLWQGVEGFGATGHLRAARLPDLARGLPLVLEVVGERAVLETFLAELRALASGALVTTEPVELSLPRRPAGRGAGPPLVPPERSSPP